RAGVLLCATTEACGGDEHALVGLVPVQCTDEGLDLWSTDGGVQGVALRLHVDAAEAEGVLVDDAVDATIVGELGAGGVPFGAAVAHGDEQIEHRLLEEGRFVRM